MKYNQYAGLKPGWVGVDFDGTLINNGKPVQAMVDKVNIALQRGEDVRIFTARVDGMSRDEEREIKWFCLKHFKQTLPITNEKTRDMKKIWDNIAEPIDV
jgi:hypothetical protein